MSQPLRLGWLDRYLTLWIFAAMLLGAVLGRFVPGMPEFLAAFEIGTTNLLIAAGLMVMMYPPLARVRYEMLPQVFADRRVLGLSLLVNWVAGPLLMFAVAVLFLHDYPDYMTGLILVGIARCIAMVLVWNQLAKGSAEYAAGLVAFNALFQIACYGLYAWFFISVLPEWIGLESRIVSIRVSDVVQSVLIYLGIPFAAGYVSRRLLLQKKGPAWYDQVFVPKTAPLALGALLFTIVVMFCLQRDLLDRVSDIVLIALPLAVYFIVMFFASFFLAWKAGADYERSTSLAFTAAGNNFELAIAVAVAVFGIGSSVAFATVVGPLVEVPVLVSLVNAALLLRRRWYTPAEGNNER